MKLHPSRKTRRRTREGGSVPAKLIIHVTYFLLFKKITKFTPISVKFINSVTIFVKFPFLLPLILTMLHLRIMLYTYWTPRATPHLPPRPTVLGLFSAATRRIRSAAAAPTPAETANKSVCRLASI